MSLTQTQVSQLYVTLFNRASEGEGNSYWQTAYSNMADTANAMLNTDAARHYLGPQMQDNRYFVTFFYEEVLGKTYTQDPSGIDYWVSELDSGKSKGEVVTALINAVTDPVNAGNAQGQFNNKVMVSDFCANNIEDVGAEGLLPFIDYIKDVTHEQSTVMDAFNKIYVDADSNSFADAVAGNNLALPDAMVGDDDMMDDDFYGDDFDSVSIDDAVNDGDAVMADDADAVGIIGTPDMSADGVIVGE